MRCSNLASRTKNPSGYSSTFYDAESDTEYTVQISTELYFEDADGNVSCYMPSCVHILNETGGSIDLSNIIETIYYNGYMTGTRSVSCKLSIYVCTIDNSNASSFSISSNSVIYESEIVKPTIEAPTPTNLSLSDDYVLTFDCNLSEFGEFVENPSGYSSTFYDEESDTEYTVQISIELCFDDTYGNVSYYMPSCVHVLDGETGSIDLSDKIEDIYTKSYMSDPYLISCRICIYICTFDLSDSSPWSSSSNEVVYTTTTLVENIDVAPLNPVICLGNSYYLGIAITPIDAYYRNVEWSSDNDSIVAVDDNGKITGVGIGTANVTATIFNTSTTVPVTVYSISSNVKDAQENTTVIETAGDIIDDIANNDNPDLSNTDINLADLNDIKTDIQEAVANGDDFYTDIVANQKDFNLNSNEWGQVKIATGNANSQFEGAYNIEVEMYHEDESGNETQIGNITEFDNEISFTLELPAGMKGQITGNEKEYVLVRIHENADGTKEYSLIDYTINPDGTFTAASDMYSSFVWCSVKKNSSNGTTESSSTPTPPPAPTATSTPAPTATATPSPTPVASADLLGGGVAHVQDIGDTPVSVDPATGVLTIGTTGQGKRLEEITIEFENTTGYEGTMEYRVHVQDIGWMDWTEAGNPAGTEGLSKRIEAIEIRLTGELAKYYSVEYCVHIQDYGDMQGWVKDGALAGTTGESKRIEQIKVRIVPKGTGTPMAVNYRVHVQDYGWEKSYATNGAMAGTSGESKRLEGIEIFLSGTQYGGGIMYKTHVQNIGWESAWAKDGEMSGTQGQSLRLEGISIELYGEVAEYYDIYYRVHAQDIGWLSWAKNGEYAGTAGRSARLEGIQIVLVPKGSPAPDATYMGITAVDSRAFVEGF